MKPNDLGKKFVVEECQRIEISSFLKSAKTKMKEMLLKSEVNMADIDIELTTSNTGFGGTRYWFKCPVCKKRVGTLFSHPITSNIGCRECLNLEYAKRRFKGMVELETNLK